LVAENYHTPESLKPKAHDSDAWQLSATFSQSPYGCRLGKSGFPDLDPNPQQAQLFAISNSFAEPPILLTFTGESRWTFRILN
jgi:hypothetical protein